MNYLFHFVLSGSDEDIVVGNFIADHIRGTKIMQELPNSVLKGVLLHRAIDAYSDMHPQVRNSVRLLKPSHARYSAVAVDILYDHFLIKNWKHFFKTSFNFNINLFHNILTKKFDILPPKSKKIARHMIEGKWIEKYETFSGLNIIFTGLTKRTHFENALPETVKYLVKFYDELEKDFMIFAWDLFDFASLHSKYRL